MAKKYIVALTVEEREKLLTLIGSGTAKARTLTHARILLKADEGWPDPQICKALHVSIPTIERVRKRFVFEGFEAVLKPRRPHRIYSRKLDGEQEAHLIALVCGAPPKGYARWSLRLLAERVVQLNIVEQVSHETIRRVLAQNELKPWRKQEWCIPPRANAEFVYHMEDVLDVYKRPVNVQHPLVCFDETPEQLISETRPALPMQRGQPQRYDFEYRRGECVHVLCTLAKLALRESHRPSHESRLGVLHARFGGCAFPAGRKDCARARPVEYTFTRWIV